MDKIPGGLPFEAQDEPFAAQGKQAQPAQEKCAEIVAGGVLRIDDAKIKIAPISRDKSNHFAATTLEEPHHTGKTALTCCILQHIGRSSRAVK